MEKEQETKETIETQEKEVAVDYERIDKTINTKIETEVGKFLKTFIENNGFNKPQAETTNTETETEQERELKEWRI